MQPRGYMYVQTRKLPEPIDALNLEESSVPTVR